MQKQILYEDDNKKSKSKGKGKRKGAKDAKVRGEKQMQKQILYEDENSQCMSTLARRKR